MNKSLRKKMLSLFPVEVMKFDLNNVYEHWAAVAEDLQDASETEGGITEGNVKTSFIEDWHQHSRVLPLWEELDSLMLAAVSNYCYINSIENVEITDSWYTIMNKGSRVHRHRHEGSVISGTLYIDIPDDSLGLAFVNPTIPYRMNEFVNNSNPSNTYAHVETVKTGDLLLFPSWLEHFVPPINYDNRISISFNTAYPIFKEIHNG